MLGTQAPDPGDTLSAGGLSGGRATNRGIFDKYPEQIGTCICVHCRIIINVVLMNNYIELVILSYMFRVQAVLSAMPKHVNAYVCSKSQLINNNWNEKLENCKSVKSKKCRKVQFINENT